MGLKEDVRNLFTGKQDKGTAHSLKDDDNYECDGAEGGGGSVEVHQRNLRPRKAATDLNNSTIPVNTDLNGADISDPNVSEPNNADISKPNNDISKPNNADVSEPDNVGITRSISEPNSVNILDDSTLHVDLASKTAHPQSPRNESAPLIAEDKSPVQPIAEGDELTTHSPQDASKPPPSISPSSSDAMSGPRPTSTTPVSLADPVVVGGCDDIVMNTDPALAAPNASLLDAIEIPAIDPYPPESLKNGTFVWEYATLLLRAPEGEPLPVFWFALVHNWIELEEKWERIELEPEKLPKDRRPQAFASWFQAGRTKRPGGRVPPASVQLPSFCDEWWLWYDALNPDWRPHKGSVVLPGGDGEWEELECSGKDGFALLLVGLRWWFDRGGLDDKLGLGHWEHTVKGLYDTTVCLHKRRYQAAASSGLGVQETPTGATKSRRDRVRKSPDSCIDNGPDSH
ncbi:hypothetical protein V5O48_006995 [Marasmius crinis-equi]|uniref:Uncharacterized protein n=1 Tax=Marasmius crinis-equi TaxID=585013 RepID=A0ABR3FI53_9AGAR